jgi:hypothetical protein
MKTAPTGRADAVFPENASSIQTRATRTGVSKAMPTLPNVTTTTQDQKRRIDPDLLPDPPRRRSRKRGTAWRPSNLRPQWRKQIKRVLLYQFGCPLPHDDSSEERFALLCHASFDGLPLDEIAKCITGTAVMWVPWAAQAKLDALIDDVTHHPRDLDRKKIGQELNLTQAVRMHPDVRAHAIWPIKFTHKQWKRWRAQVDRERSARTRTRKKAAKPPRPSVIAIGLLEQWLTAGPMAAAEIVRLAINAGIQKPGARLPGKALRNARKALGIKTEKSGLDGGWWWSLPEPENASETPYISEDALLRPGCSETPCFPEDALLRPGTPLGDIPEQHDRLPSAETPSEPAAAASPGHPAPSAPHGGLACQGSISRSASPAPTITDPASRAKVRIPGTTDAATGEDGNRGESHRDQTTTLMLSRRTRMRRMQMLGNHMAVEAARCEARRAMR